MKLEFIFAAQLLLCDYGIKLGLMSQLLSKQKAGLEYIIQNIEGDPFRVARLQELGFIRGAKILFKSKIIFGEPFIVEVSGSQIALRKSEADCIQVTSV